MKRIVSGVLTVSAVLSALSTPALAKNCFNGRGGFNYCSEDPEDRAETQRREREQDERYRNGAKTSRGQR